MSQVEYARTADGTHIAYRVLDPDPECVAGHDIVIASGGLFPMEVLEEDPGFVRLLEGLASLGRVVVFDRRGIGLSDPIVAWDQPILDQWAEDLSAVVEASGVQGAVVFAWDGYGVGSRFAAKHPAGLRLLVLHHPLMFPEDGWDHWVGNRLALLRENVAGEHDAFLEQIAPSRASDASFRDWYAPAEAVRLAAAQINGSMLVELDGADHFPFVGDVDAVVAEITDFVVGERRLPSPQRLLAALMFTDLVGSTERAAALGDDHWKSVLDRHDRTVRNAVGSLGGEVVKTTGDGVLALLPSASAVVRAAERVRDALAADGLEVRIGIHVGDVERRGDDVSGLGVHIAARAMAVAEASQVVATASVPLAITGQAAAFENLGGRNLKGVPGVWELFRLANTQRAQT